MRTTASARAYTGLMEFDPDWLPYRLDPVLRRVLWVRMPAAARAGAAFLDERALGGDTQGAWAPLESLEAMPPPARVADAVFHIGHCGSTLLTRVLEAWPGLQALREPLPLRTQATLWPLRGHAHARLSDGACDAVLDGLWRAWSRPAGSGARVVVKATSGCNALADPLLQRWPAMRAVLVDMPLAPWLATLLKSPGSVADALEHAPARLQDFAARAGADGIALHALSLPRQLALCWLAEQARFAALADAHPHRVLRIDFEALLADAPAVLARIAAHLGLPGGGLDAALQSPAWRRYAKADTHAYDAGDRAHDLAMSRRQSGPSIDDAVAWARAHVARHPVLQHAADRVA